MGYKRILCAVDFSDHSNAAFYRAVELAERFSSNLTVLHATEMTPLVSRWLAPEGMSDLTIQIENRARDAMDQLLGTVPQASEKLKIKSEITSGRPAAEILENARVWGADLIVLGARGAGSIEQAVMGSTVNRVITEAECSVLVVKA